MSLVNDTEGNPITDESLKKTITIDNEIMKISVSNDVSIT